MILAAELGLEPRQTVPETGVLPLHNSAIRLQPEACNARYYSKADIINQALIPFQGSINPSSVSLSLTLPISSKMGSLLAGFLSAKAGWYVVMMK